MFSIIICSTNAPRFEAVCGEWRRVLEQAREPYELVGVHDARSLCEGYRRGLAASRGDITVFSHDDIELWSDDFAVRLKRHLATYDGVGIAGTSKLVGVSWLDAGPPHMAGHVAHREGAEAACTLMIYGGVRRAMGKMQALDGVLLAFRRAVIERVGWDAETFDGFHFYDLDTTYRAFRAGYNLAVALDLPVCHYSGGSYDNHWERYAKAFLQKHGATLEQMLPRRVVPMGVKMQSKEEIRKVMAAIAESVPE
jgi:hypothetical protein